MIHTAGVGRYVGEGALGFAPLDEAGPAGVLDDYLALLANPTGPVGLGRMIRATAAMTAMLLDGAPAVAARIGADAVLADMAEPAGALMARRMGLPWVATVTGLPLMEEPDVPPPFVDWPYLPGPAGRFRNQGGYAVARLLMRPIRRVVEDRARAWGVAADGVPLLHVAQCPAAFDFPRRALPPAFHYGAPWRLPEEDAPALDEARPLVFCSLGTLQGRRKEMFAAMTQACADLGARAVVAHGGGMSDGEAAALPGEPLVRAWWPQRAVLAKCRAAVLHGGFNTVIDALAAGTPIVAVPIAFEQPATAARIEWLRAGRMAPFRRASRRSLAEALRTVLDDPLHAQAAARVRSSLAGRDGAGDAADRISAALAPAHLH